MRRRSPANSAASSPPVPGRISSMAGRASASSLGRSASCSACSASGMACSRRSISSSARSRISGSSASARASTSSACNARHSAMRVTTGLSSEYSLAMAAMASGAAPAPSCASRNSKRSVIWRRRSCGSIGAMCRDAAPWSRGPMIKGPVRSRTGGGDPAHDAAVHTPVVVPTAEREKTSTRVASPSSWRRIDTASGKPKTRERAT
jgi:hypothetical protein